MRTGQFSQNSRSLAQGQERSDGHKDVTRVIRGWLSAPFFVRRPGMGDPFDVIPFEVCP